MLAYKTCLKIKLKNMRDDEFKFDELYFTGLCGAVLSTISKTKPTINDRIYFASGVLVPHIVENKSKNKILTSWHFNDKKNSSVEFIRTIQNKIMNHELDNVSISDFLFIQSKENYRTASNYEKENNYIEQNLYSFIRNAHDNTWFVSEEDKEPAIGTERCIKDIIFVPIKFVKKTSGFFSSKYEIEWVPQSSSLTKEEFIQSNISYLRTPED